MTTGQVPGVDDLWSAPPVSCACGHGDIGAEMDRQRPLVARAIAGDHRAFGQLYDEHVDDVYRYLLAWTGEGASARELTEQVFNGALTWLKVIADGEGDLAAWLITMARDAVVQYRGTGWVTGPDQLDSGPHDVFSAVQQLDDAQRETIVLRLLLGHSLAHTAHLAGYSGRVVEELQLAGCSSVWQMLSGMPVEPPPPGSEELRPRWFERCLAGAHLDPASDAGLSDVVAVADALRQGAAEHVPLPDDVFVNRLREQLLRTMEGGDGAERPRRPRRPGRLGRTVGLIRFHVARHPWVATTIAASAIGVVFGLQVAGGTPTRSTCGNRPCLVTTTAAAATSEDGGLGVPPVSSGPDSTDPSTTAPIQSTTSASAPSTTRAQGAAPSTAPPTTAPRTTRTTQRPTTTRRTTTTVRKTTTSRRPTTTSGSTTSSTEPQQGSPGGP
jgi:RNA polymerase sigma-70 factor (ECF subfamily)